MSTVFNTESPRSLALVVLRLFKNSSEVFNSLNGNQFEASLIIPQFLRTMISSLFLLNYSYEKLWRYFSKIALFYRYFCQSIEKSSSNFWRKLQVKQNNIYDYRSYKLNHTPRKAYLMKDISSLSSIYNRIYSDSRNFAVMTLAATRRILLHFRYTPHPQPLKAYCQSPYDEIPVSHLFCYLCTMQ